MKVKGGRTTFGEAIGILLLDTVHPRIPGDVGNASTYDFPVRLMIVQDTKEKMFYEKSHSELLSLFIRSAEKLEQEGVRAITTSCGFMSKFQRELANSVNIPMFTSSLMQVPLVHRMLNKNKMVGIITANSKALTEEYLIGAGIDHSIPIAITGLEEQDEFSRVFLSHNQIEMDRKKIENEVIQAAKILVNKNKDIGAIVFECTNLCPYSYNVQKEIKLPVFNIVTLVNLVYNAVVTKKYIGFM